MNQTSEVPKAILPLRAVTKRLKELLIEVESKRFWVQAQFVPENGGQSQGGHCYCSLVEHNEAGRTVTRMKAVIWKSHRERIEQKLREAGCKQILTEQQEICALSPIRFHHVYGLGLEICDVDPTLGVSLVEKNRHEVLEWLRAADLLNRKKSLSLPAVPSGSGPGPSPPLARRYSRISQKPSYFPESRFGFS